MKLHRLLMGAAFVLALPVTTAHANSSTDPGNQTEALSRTLYAAYNMNGPTTVVDGVSFTGEASAPELSTTSTRVCDATSPIVNPLTSTALGPLLRCFVWGGYENQGGVALDVKVANVPQGSYEVTLFSWEDTNAEIFSALLEGQQQELIESVPGEWRTMGPYSVDVNDGTLNIGSFNGALNVSAIKIDRLVDPTPPKVEPQARFKPVNPVRVLDTRAESAVNYSGAKPGDGALVEVPVAGLNGLPATGITAAVLNITAVDAAKAGFVTAFASGTARPFVSNVNPMYVGHTVPNMAIVPVGANGRVTLYTLASAHLVVDISGYFTAEGGGTDGRYHAVVPGRVLDTRADTAVNYSGARPAVGARVKVPIRNVANVPSNASAVAVTITATESTGAAFVTAYPSGSGVPLASNLNVPSANFTIANSAIVPIGDDGKIELFTSNSAHLVVDVQGWFGNGTEDGTAGYFVAQTPSRTADSRVDTRIGLPVGPFAPPNFLTPSLGVKPAGQAVGAVVYNMTITETARPGFLASYPSGAPWPGSSNLNASAAGDTVAAASITALGSNGAMTVYHYAGGQLIIDVSGWFTA